MAKKKQKNKSLSIKRATTFFNNKLGGDARIPVPKGYDTWIQYLMVYQEVPKPFRSWLEVRAYYKAESLVSVQYEPGKYPYTITQQTNYIPDLVYKKQGVVYWGECKGRFRTMAEAKKYLDVRRTYPDIVLFFILEKANVALPGATIRKTCGTKRTIEEWLEVHGIEYTYVDKLEEWMNES